MDTIEARSSASEGTQTAVSSAVYAKYGEASIAGFQAVPDLLLKHQGHLGLSSTDLAVLLHVLMHWWYPEKKPYALALSPETVREYLRKDPGQPAKRMLVRTSDERLAEIVPAPLFVQDGIGLDALNADRMGWKLAALALWFVGLSWLTNALLIPPHETSGEYIHWIAPAAVIGAAYTWPKIAKALRIIWNPWPLLAGRLRF